MISVLVRKIMTICRLRQQDLADLLEVPIQRVKRLSGGDAKKFTQEEQVALIEKLSISPAWLITGEGSMFRDQPQDVPTERLYVVRQEVALLAAMPLSDSLREQTAAKLTGDPAQDGAMIAEAMRYEMAGSATVLSARESALVENYRAATEDAKQALETTSAALAQCKAERKEG